MSIAEGIVVFRLLKLTGLCFVFLFIRLLCIQKIQRFTYGIKLSKVSAKVSKLGNPMRHGRNVPLVEDDS